MLKIEFQVSRLDGSFRNVCALINADSAASWLCKTTEFYGKIIITKVDYID